MTVSAFLDLDYPNRLGFSCLDFFLFEFFFFGPFFYLDCLACLIFRFFKNLKRDRSERQTAWTRSFEDQE